jgi:hypothetical protein
MQGYGLHSIKNVPPFVPFSVYRCDSMSIASTL